MRDLIKAKEVVDEIKQREDFTLTFRVLDLTSCGLIGVSVDRFGCPTDHDSKTVKVYSQAGMRDFHRREISRVFGCQRQVQRA